jgi:hypothetical protein
MERAYTKLREGLNDSHVRFTPATVAGAKRAWTLSSRRFWHALEGCIITTSHGGRRHDLVPFLVETDKGFFILEAVGKLLANDAFYATPTEGCLRIGRKVYVPLTAKKLDAILYHGSWFRDGFYRTSSEHTVGDTLDIGVFILGAMGRPTTVEAIITAWETVDANTFGQKIRGD